MILLLYAFSYLVMLALPIALGVWIHRTRGASWRLFLIGAVTFVGSQIFHIPFNWLVQQRLQLLPADTTVVTNLIVVAAFLGLSAGVFEESARYLVYRFWAKDARSWGKGLMLGAGHGGIESILLGVLAAINVGSLALMNSGQLQQLIPPEQAALVEAQIAAVFGVPWYMALLPAVERVFALALHLSLSILVLQVFTRRNLLWLLLAILWHALANFLAVFGAVTWGAVAAELLLAATAVVSVVIIFWLRRPEPKDPEPQPLPAAKSGPDRPPEVTDEMLDRSRYS